MSCRCCGAVGKNATGCSCGGGKSHSCRRENPMQPIPVVASNTQPSHIFRNMTPQSCDIWSIAAINADASNRKAIVGTWEALGNEMAQYVLNQSSGLRTPAILCVSELSPIKGADLFLNNLNKSNNELQYRNAIVKFFAGEHISLYWNANLWRNVGIKFNNDKQAGVVFSAQGRYIVVCLQTTENNPVKLLIFGVHLPHKRGRQKARTLLTEAINQLTYLNKAQAVAIVGDFNLQFNTDNHSYFPGFTAAFFGRSTTEKGRRIDNVLVNKYLAPHVKDYAKDIHNNCELFSHYPIHLHE